MKVFVLLMLTLLSFEAFSNFKKIAAEWDRRNIDLVDRRNQIELRRYDFELVGLERTWNVSYDFNYSDSDKENGPAAFIPFSSESSSHNLAISKDFDWGGNFTFNNLLTSTDFGQESGLAIPQFYQFAQGFRYTQNLGADFLGRIYKKEKMIANENVNLAKLEYDEERERGMFELLNRYTRASLTKSLISFQKQAKARADKRLNLIKKWVRDGLRERVDLYQAEAAALEAGENVKISSIDLTQSLQDLGTSLHRDILPDEIESLAEKENILSDKNLEPSENRNMKVLKSRMRVFRGRLEQAEDGILPSVQLTVGWNSNDFDADRRRAFNNGRFTKDHDEKLVELSVSWPIGSLANKVEKEQAAINLNLAQKRMEALSKDIVEIRDSLKTQLLSLEKNIASIKNRISLNKKSLKEYNRLYNRGRADLDQVIRAEETLINSEISLIRQLAEFEQRFGELSYLNGTLITYVLD